MMTIQVDRDTSENSSSVESIDKAVPSETVSQARSPDKVVVSSVKSPTKAVLPTVSPEKAVATGPQKVSPVKSPITPVLTAVSPPTQKFNQQNQSQNPNLDLDDDVDDCDTRSVKSNRSIKSSKSVRSVKSVKSVVSFAVLKETVSIGGDSDSTAFLDVTYDQNINDNTGTNASRNLKA